MATLASATFREPALNSQFQIHRSHMSFTEERIFWNSGCKLLELRRDSHKVALDSFPTKNFYDLQNKNKDEDPKILEMVSDVYDAYDVYDVMMLCTSVYTKQTSPQFRLAWGFR